MSQTRIQIAKNEIEAFFDNSPQTIYKPSELGEVFQNKKNLWRLKSTETLNNFINFLLDNSKLKKIVLNFPNRKETRYTWTKVTIYEVLMSINPKVYFSHYTAMFLNELTEQVPKTIFINTEQPPKITSYISAMEQKNIDMAFKNKARETNNITDYEDVKIYHLNGMYTDNLGIIELNLPDIGNIRVTNIERTLIDSTVRPIYSGGIFEILQAYRKAKDIVSINKLVSYLKKMNFKYPYHQLIGFYLEKTGYSNNQIDLLNQFSRNYDFYLDYQMKETLYDAKWKVFYPKGL